MPPGWHIYRQSILSHDHNTGGIATCPVIIKLWYLSSFFNPSPFIMNVNDGNDESPLKVSSCRSPRAKKVVGESQILADFWHRSVLNLWSAVLMHVHPMHPPLNPPLRGVNPVIFLSAISKCRQSFSSRTLTWTDLYMSLCTMV